MEVLTSYDLFVLHDLNYFGSTVQLHSLFDDFASVNCSFLVWQKYLADDYLGLNVNSLL